eukprot:6181131-Pleurochrysis_carterae.AAC.2
MNARLDLSARPDAHVAAYADFVTSARRCARASAPPSSPPLRSGTTNLAPLPTSSRSGRRSAQGHSTAPPDESHKRFGTSSHARGRFRMRRTSARRLATYRWAFSFGI